MLADGLINNVPSLEGDEAEVIDLYAVEVRTYKHDGMELLGSGAVCLLLEEHVNVVAFLHQEHFEHVIVACVYTIRIEGVLANVEEDDIISLFTKTGDFSV